ncbi:hypothetical protein Droror1_Dr00015577 [Drosera rotundifolia]
MKPIQFPVSNTFQQRRHQYVNKTKFTKIVIKLNPNTMTIEAHSTTSTPSTQLSFVNQHHETNQSTPRTARTPPAPLRELTPRDQPNTTRQRLTHGNPHNDVSLNPTLQIVLD